MNYIRYVDDMVFFSDNSGFDSTETKKPGEIITVYRYNRIRIQMVQT